MPTVKKIYEKLTGYKTLISGIMVVLLNGVKWIWPDIIDNHIFLVIQDFLLITFGIGAGDKIRRNINK
jgi:hypothetical protein